MVYAIIKVPEFVYKIRILELHKVVGTWLSIITCIFTSITTKHKDNILLDEQILRTPKLYSAVKQRRRFH